MGLLLNEHIARLPQETAHIETSARNSTSHIKTSAMPDSTQESGPGESTTGKNGQPSTTSLTQFIEKLDGSMATGKNNYNAGRFMIIRIVKEKDLLQAIEDEIVSKTQDDQAFTIIALNIKDTQIPHIQNATTAKEAWASLKEVHQGIGTNGRMILMQRL